jgi:E3 ubiquitin-protein ligase MARCH6
VVAGVIIVSFLSLMSFADFLRLHWQQHGARRVGIDERVHRRGAVHDVVNDPVDEGDVDYAVVNHLVRGGDDLGMQQEDMQRGAPGENAQIGNGQRRVRFMDMQPDEQLRNEVRRILDVFPNDPGARRRELQRRINAAAEIQRHLDGEDANGAAVNDDREPFIWVEPVVDDQLAIHNNALPVANEVNRRAHNRAENDRGDGRDAQMMRDFDRFEPQFEPLDPAIQDDQAVREKSNSVCLTVCLSHKIAAAFKDMEINVALDELLGLRGPLSALVRNLLWLLAFNTVYLGIFVFVPRSVGSAVFSIALNSTAVFNLMENVPYLYSGNSTDLSLLGLLDTLNEESLKLNTTFLLPDLATVTLGYFSCAATFLLLRCGWLLSRRFFRQGAIDNFRNYDIAGDQANEQGEDMAAAFGQAFTLTLEATAAVVKVGVLLFLKMFLLPLLLGIWLDASTLALFGSTALDRVRFAGHDLFASILLHWVAGITFMLLVTVSVLQLREVVHPDLLAHVIRPQEPQPDLLGNLMQESVTTHTKRMFLSLAIYAALLSVHVSIPSYILRVTNLGRCLPFFKLNLWHILLPQLQVPLELLLFHLSVLALLEKYKNHIGEMQHHWLVFMCSKLNITDHMLPRNIERFELVGSRPVFRENDLSADETSVTPQNSVSCLEVDWFWYDLLAKKNHDTDAFISSNIDPLPSEQPPCYDYGETKRNGRKTLRCAHAHIRLPYPSSDWLEAAKFPPPDQPNQLPHLLPPSIGSYRLKVTETGDRQLIIQFWKEIPGELIPRPPEGWDDLGVGGAIVQGRWAWGKERKSTIEEGVAHRMLFFSATTEWTGRLVPFFKIAILLFCSWLAVFSLSCALMSIPLITGRLLYLIFRVPDRFVHDPLAFVLGDAFLFALVRVLRSLRPPGNNGGLWGSFRRWIRAFRLPPRKKALFLLSAGILWFIVSPVLLGILYELAVVKSSQWFLEEMVAFDVSTLLLAWLVGSILLNSWAFLCHVQVFTFDFWINIGMEENQDGDDNVDADRLPREHEAVRVEEEQIRDAARVEPRRRQLLNWQGSDGRIARFMDVWRAVIVNWEWEKVDPVILLHDCAVPLVTQLAAAFACPALSYYIYRRFLTVVRRGDASGIVCKYTWFVRGKATLISNSFMLQCR